MARAIDRETVARYVRTYVAAPRYAGEHRVRMTAADGVQLTGWALPGPPEAVASVVLVHGFANWSRSPRIHAFAHLLAARAPVIVLDLRGHGESEGTCTIGRDEPLDVAAAVAAARQARPDLPVVTVGVSLGAGAVLLHAAAAEPGSLAVVVAVSPPAYWERDGGEGASRIARLVASPVGRWGLARLTRTRIGRWDGRTDPVDAVGAIAPATTVVVHDPADWYFDERHAQALYDAASEPKELWWYPGGGHGTDLLTPELADRVLALAARSPLSGEVRRPGA
ncbi:MAG TPA: alpha/beta hydrolase [Acidimicrobiales bacterium]|nr:alpha/beta hydrolase [Acidimicrobiales bacterium]